MVESELMTMKDVFLPIGKSPGVSKGHYDALLVDPDASQLAQLLWCQATAAGTGSKLLKPGGAIHGNHCTSVKYPKILC